jgi:hypothetical protein
MVNRKVYKSRNTQTNKQTNKQTNQFLVFIKDYFRGIIFSFGILTVLMSIFFVYSFVEPSVGPTEGNFIISNDSIISIINNKLDSLNKSINLIGPGNWDCITVTNSDYEVNPKTTASCPSGYTLISGGCKFDYSSSAILTENSPYENMWECAVVSGTNTQLTVAAYCCK